MDTLGDVFEAVVRRHASRTAIVEGDRALSYADLERRARALAEALHEGGVAPGHRVAVMLPNGSACVASYLAVVRAGAVVVPLNDRYERGELVRFLTASRASCLVTSAESGPLARSVLDDIGAQGALLVVDGGGMVVSSRGRAVSAAAAPPPNAAAPVLHQFSSGSTGRPKSIVRTHANLVAELDAFARTLAFSPGDRFLGVTPFSHVNGLMRSMLASLHAGATLYPLPRFERQAVARLIEDHRLSVFIAVPLMFTMLTRGHAERRADLSSLRWCVSGSAPLPRALNVAFHDSFGLYVRQLYGSTETGTISVNTLPDVRETLESVGRPLAGVAVDVFADDGRPTADGEVGELGIRSPAAIRGYDEADAPERTAFRDGYYLTGDLGRKDRDGLLYLVGRKTLLINRGGYKVNPREIEELLESHPKIAEAVVLGVPTPFGDERIRAVVVTSAPCTEAEIVEHCRGRIADFKIPSTVEIRDSLPKSVTGKVRRDAV